MPKRKSVKKIIKQKQKQSTKINITIDNSKKTASRNTQQKPSNNNRYDSMPTYHMFYNPPPTPLIQSNKEENKPNPLTKSVASQTYINKNNFETQTEPIPQTQSFETQTERQNAETQTEPKKIKIKISKIKTPSVNFTTPTQENNLIDQVYSGSDTFSFNNYDDLPERRKMIPQPFDELNTPSVKEKVKIINERLKQISVNNNPLDSSKNSVGRPRKKEGDPKGKYTKRTPPTTQKPFESPVGNKRDTQQL